MKQALIYIAVIFGVYIVIDVILYFIADANVRKLLARGRKFPINDSYEKTLDELSVFLNDVKDWIENEHKLEYKCVWVGNRFAEALEGRLKVLDFKEPQREEEQTTDESLDRLEEQDEKDVEEVLPDDIIEEAMKTAVELDKFGPKYIWTLAKAFGIAIILALFIRTFMVQAFKIPSGSMIPTLHVGDQLLVNKFRYGVQIPFTEKKIFGLWEPQRGDVVVFKPPASVGSSWVTTPIVNPFNDNVIYEYRHQVDFIKRIVGLPGDRIEIKDGVLYVNDQEMVLEPLEDFDYKKKTGDYTRNVDALLFNEQLNGHEHLVIHNDSSREEMNSEDEGPFHVGPGEFFAMGDNRDDSQDSRRWGGAAAKLKDIRGKAFIIHFSWDPVQNKPRLGRIGHWIR